MSACPLAAQKTRLHQLLVIISSECATDDGRDGYEILLTGPYLSSCIDIYTYISDHVAFSCFTSRDNLYSFKATKFKANLYYSLQDIYISDNSHDTRISLRLETCPIP
jgi:hypothetical protein